MEEKVKKIAESLADFNTGLWVKKEYYKPFLDIIKPKNRDEESTVIWSIILLEMFNITEVIRYNYLEDDYEKLITEYYKFIFERLKKKFVLKKEMLNSERFMQIIESLHLRYHIILLQHDKDEPSPYWYVCKDTIEELSKEINLDEGKKIILLYQLLTSTNLWLKHAINVFSKIKETICKKRF